LLCFFTCACVLLFSLSLFHCCLSTFTLIPFGSYCEQEERYPLVYGASRKRRSAYCEFEYFFREDIATALNVTTSRVLVLLMKAASRDHSLVYFRILPPATVSLSV